MLLVVDIGNTHTVFGFITGKKVKHQLRLASDLRKTVDEWGMLMTAFAATHRISLRTVKNAVLASVVPGLTPMIRQMIERYCRARVLVVSADLKLGLTFGYRHPQEIGADRLANAVAVTAHYKLPAIVVDMGTATTFDIITKGGHYAGGVILPGVETSFTSLAQKTALLPKIDVAFPPSVIGATTRECMQAGIVYGTIDQIKGIITRIEKKLKARCTVVLTGGWANPFVTAFKDAAIFDPDLTLEGLRLIGIMVRQNGKADRRA
jgi:type III pantothenate kinase